MTAVAPASRRGLNSLVAAFFSVASLGYDLPILQWYLYRPPQDDVVRALEAAGARTVADIGCGTGILTSRLARDLDTVWGIDMSPGMLAKARRRNPAVRWRNEPAEQLSLPDASVDAVTTTTAFHFFDQARALREFHRVLRPGGVAVVCTPATDARWARPIQRSSARRLMPAHAPTSAEIRKVFQDAGFEIVEQRAVTRPWYSRWVPDVITVGKRG
ncbi:class I SAM-dependent methyltransferase [Nocardia huaxiensis]|uniref:Class I SAM-dependent methyltransferase n=1 Tax=Nocardia huaxiensis TaxID=2755382 RepID=A0A7D6Z1A5_9NOCA|nr:class I SAM-dependent methyltransferase [Nocardia huaxiensis]QLY28044.1 class I SAM-dependent methyltransferase [Nocardia huaxiensis]